MYLLDTNVISELRKAKAGKADSKVVAWAERVPMPSLFLSVITLLELETPRSDRDALIAATALVHNLTVVTRNVADFELTGVRIMNPWTA